MDGEWSEGVFKMVVSISVLLIMDINMNGILIM